MDTRDAFLTEFQLLEFYYNERKSRAAAKMPVQEGSSRGGVTDKLTYIVDSTIFFEGGVVHKSAGGSDVIPRLVELLKESADKLNEKIMRDHELLGFLQNSFSYTVFENVASAFIHSVVPSSELRKDVRKKQIAWTFEMTCRLRALDLQPMNRVMGFGAQYLHQHFAQWIQQHGGWEEAFKGDESDDEVQ